MGEEKYYLTAEIPTKAVQPLSTLLAEFYAKQPHPLLRIKDHHFSPVAGMSSEAKSRYYELLEKREGIARERIIKLLNNRPREASNILNITFTTPSRTLAENFASSLTKYYLESLLEAPVTEAYDHSTFTPLFLPFLTPVRVFRLYTTSDYS